MKKTKRNSGFPSGSTGKRKLSLIACCTGLALILGTGTAMAQSPVLLVPETQTEEAYGPGIEADQIDTTRIQAVVKAVEGEKILVESQSGEADPSEILLNTSAYDTRFVNGESGFQAELADIKVGDMIYADIHTTMAESLPLQATAAVILWGMPEGGRAPDYILTAAFAWQEDESWRLVSSSGTVYQVPKDYPIISYGMNQLSSFRIISESNRLLVWLDEEDKVQRIVKLPARW